MSIIGVIIAGIIIGLLGKFVAPEHLEEVELDVAKVALVVTHDLPIGVGTVVTGEFY